MVAVVPARLAARRLPDKPLRLLAGTPLVWHVHQRVAGWGAPHELLVATDDATVAEVVLARGGRVHLDDTPCDCGTVRVARAVADLDADFVLNVQGDQPLLDPAALDAVLELLRAGAPIATVSAPLAPERLPDPHSVKVVTRADGQALYFSRAPVPGDLHLGVYGFTADALRQLAALPRGSLARAEDLEQLTWLEAGWPIAVARLPEATPSVDTEADLAAVAQTLSMEEPTE